jgi:thymidylate kinase
MFAIVIYVPRTHAAAVRAALAASGAGAIGLYDSCSFSAVGVGRFRPLAGAQPHIGTAGVVEEVEEERIETVVTEERVRDVVAAVKRAHPYEEPAIHLSSILDYKLFLPANANGAAAAAAAAAASSSASASSSSSSPLPVPPTSVVVEGLDGVGKSTAAAALAQRLGAVLLRTPPDSMRSFRSYFHDPSRPDEAGNGSAAMRKAYYMVGNFVAGSEMAGAVRSGRSAVCDRYFPSTVAYVRGKSGAGEDGRGILDPLPPAGDPAWAWPAELERPAHLLLLTLPEPVRVRRRAGRAGVAETAEEALLAARPEVAERINEGYRRMGCKEVRLEEGDGVEAVVDKMVRAILAAPPARA